MRHKKLPTSFYYQTNSISAFCKINRGSLWFLEVKEVKILAVSPVYDAEFLYTFLQSEELINLPSESEHSLKCEQEVDSGNQGSKMLLHGRTSACDLVCHAAPSLG